MNSGVKEEQLVTNGSNSVAQGNGSLESSWVMAVMGKDNAMFCSVLGNIFNVAGLHITMVIK